MIEELGKKELKRQWEEAKLEDTCRDFQKTADQFLGRNPLEVERERRDKVIYTTLEGQEFTYNSIGRLPNAERVKFKEKYPDAYRAYEQEVSDRMPPPRPTPSAATPQTLFQSQGFLWNLTNKFWDMAPRFDPDQAHENGDGGMVGPLCHTCLTDVTDQLKCRVDENRVCFVCKRPLTNRFIDMRDAHPFATLRSRAYRDAQAAMRRGEIVRM
jgi:hypothetical protein